MEGEGFVGILSLDTAFPRVLGDAGNVDSYPMPARVKIVKDVDSTDIVRNGHLPTKTIDKFSDAAKELEQEGARAIVSTCGFLVTAQQKIASAVNIPVMVSSLSLYVSVKSVIDSNLKIGIVTASKANLGKAAFKAAGIDADKIEVVGLEDCREFHDVFLVPKDLQKHFINTGAVETALLDKIRNLLKSSSDIGALIFECGNLPPYSKKVQQEIGLPVYTILDAADLMWQF